MVPLIMRSASAGPTKGFSIIEMMIAVTVLMLISGVGWMITARELRREEVNSVAVDLAGWLQSIQSAATARPDSTSTLLANGCTVTFSGADGSTISPGSLLATVTPSGCSSESTFRVPGGNGSSSDFTVDLSGGTGAWANQVVFTPRSTVTATNNVLLRIRLSGTRLMRCVRVGATLGQIQIGRNNDADQAAATTCPADSFGGMF
jgi:Tfp pilus assembly protein FimT